jgi:hypothetical protein
MERYPNEADSFIESIASLAEDAKRGATHAYRTALADESTHDDARRLETEGEELALIDRLLRELASRLYGYIVLRGPIAPKFEGEHQS